MPGQLSAGRSGTDECTCLSSSPAWQVTTPIFQVGKLRPREMMGLFAPGLVAHMWRC